MAKFISTMQYEEHSKIYLKKKRNQGLIYRIKAVTGIILQLSETSWNVYCVETDQPDTEYFLLTDFTTDPYVSPLVAVSHRSKGISALREKMPIRSPFWTSIWFSAGTSKVRIPPTKELGISFWPINVYLKNEEIITSKPSEVCNVREFYYKKNERLFLH